MLSVRDNDRVKVFIVECLRVATEKDENGKYLPKHERRRIRLYNGKTARDAGKVGNTINFDTDDKEAETAQRIKGEIEQVAALYPHKIFARCMTVLPDGSEKSYGSETFNGMGKADEQEEDTDLSAGLAKSVATLLGESAKGMRELRLAFENTSEKLVTLSIDSMENAYTYGKVQTLIEVGDQYAAAKAWAESTERALPDFMAAVERIILGNAAIQATQLPPPKVDLEQPCPETPGPARTEWNMEAILLCTRKIFGDAQLHPGSVTREQFQKMQDFMEGVHAQMEQLKNGTA